MSPVGPGSLKCVVIWSKQRPLRGLIEQALRARVAGDDVRHLRGETFLVYTEADTATVRDWLAALLEDGEGAFVVEFERWSGAGGEIDRDWLRRRGH